MRHYDLSDPEEMRRQREQAARRRVAVATTEQQVLGAGLLAALARFCPWAGADKEVEIALMHFGALVVANWFAEDPEFAWRYCHEAGMLYRDQDEQAAEEFKHDIVATLRYVWENRQSLTAGYEEGKHGTVE